jgi:hypothetical protein
VVDAADALLLVATEEERRAAVRTRVLNEDDSARGGAERDQVLAQQADADRCTVRIGDFLRKERRHPVLAHEVTHERARADTGERLVVLNAEHR